MLFELLDRQAADRPHQPALIHGDEKLTWGELRDRASRLSSGLAALGIGPDDTVGMLLPNGAAFVTALLSLARIGAQALPLSIDFKSPEIHAALDSSGCRTLLAADSAANVCRQILDDRSASRILQVSCEDFGQPSLARLVGESVGGCTGSTASDVPFFQFLTSGTTGNPRRVLRSQAALCALASAYCGTADMSDADRVLCVIPLHHGHGLCGGLLASLFSGATLFLEAGFERRSTLRLLNQERITAFSAPPFIYSVLAETRMTEEFRCPSLRLPFTSGAPLHRDAWTTVRDRLGIRLRQFYGASETGVVAINMDDDPEPSAESAGRPIAGVEVSISNESGEPAGADVEGEIAVRSPGAGGWSAPLESGHPLTRLADANGWIHMADRGRLDSQGRLYLTGRKSSFLNIAGRKVNPLEVEAVLTSYPAVTKASVVPVRDDLGNESARAVVYCAAPCTREALIAFCRERLAPYKIPRVIEVRDNADRLK